MSNALFVCGSPPWWKSLESLPVRLLGTWYSKPAHFRLHFTPASRWLLPARSVQLHKLTGLALSIQPVRTPSQDPAWRRPGFRVKDCSGKAPRTDAARYDCAASAQLQAATRRMRAIPHSVGSDPATSALKCRGRPGASPKAALEQIQRREIGHSVVRVATLARSDQCMAFEMPARGPWQTKSACDADRSPQSMLWQQKPRSTNRTRAGTAQAQALAISKSGFRRCRMLVGRPAAAGRSYRVIEKNTIRRTAASADHALTSITPIHRPARIIS